MNQMDVAKILWQKWQFQPKICMNQMDPKRAFLSSCNIQFQVPQKILNFYPFCSSFCCKDTSLFLSCSHKKAKVALVVFVGNQHSLTPLPTTATILSFSSTKKRQKQHDVLCIRINSTTKNFCLKEKAVGSYEYHHIFSFIFYTYRIICVPKEFEL